MHCHRNHRNPKHGTSLAFNLRNYVVNFVKLQQQVGLASNCDILFPTENVA